MKKEIIYFGSLVIILFATIFYVQFDDSVKIGLHNDYTVLKVFNFSGNEKWLIAGKEFDALFDGTSKMNRRKSGIKRSYWNDSAYFYMQRVTPYIRGPVVVDTYKFSKHTTKVEQVPIEGKREVYNASGFYYRYIVDELTDTGPKRKLNGETFLEFGLNTNVELHPGYRWAWIGSNNLGKGSDSLAAQYDIKSDYEVFYFRLFDPPVNIGDVKEFRDYDKNGRAELFRDGEIIGFKPVYKIVERTKEVCDNFIDNETLVNSTVCKNISFKERIVNNDLRGTPVYRYSSVKKLRVDNEEFDFKNKGCWVCGSFIACLSNLDGYSEHRGEEFKCDENNYPIIRSGESGWISKIGVSDKVFERSDVGEVK